MTTLDLDRFIWELAKKHTAWLLLESVKVMRQEKENDG